jgi:hypothetical protein
MVQGIFILTEMKMKKAILLTIVITFLVSVHARTQNFEAGIRTGLGLSTYSGWNSRSSGDDDLKRFPLVGYHIGLSGQYHFSELLGLKAELQLIQRGEGLELTGTEKTSYKGKVNMTYFTLPIMAAFSHSFGNILVFGQAGPYFGFGLTAKKVSLDPSKTVWKVNFSESAAHRFDIGCIVGVGAGYPVGPGNIIFDLRYDIGFLDVNSPPDETKNDPYKAYCNRTFEIAIGYLIKIGKQ